MQLLAPSESRREKTVSARSVSQNDEEQFQPPSSSPILPAPGPQAQVKNKNGRRAKNVKLARQWILAYTHSMHSIAPEWTDLAAGYQAVQSLSARLENEFGHAVQAGRKQQFLKQLTEWQKKRRAFIVLAVLAPLSIITLCLIAYYRRDVACVIVYWVILVGIILVTLALAGRSYIREVMNRPNQEGLKTLPVDLERRWWNSLAPQLPAVMNVEDKDKVDFLRIASQVLPETCLVSLTPALLLFTPGGLWLFQVVSWSGTIIRQDGVWQQILIVKDKAGRKQSQVQPFQLAPDEEWLQHKRELAENIEERIPQQPWNESLIQGGVVFTHPKASPDKATIRGNLAAYGTARGWVERLRTAPTVEGFTSEIQLEIYESLRKPAPPLTASAKELAERLYQEGALELRQSIVKMVRTTG